MGLINPFFKGNFDFISRLFAGMGGLRPTGFADNQVRRGLVFPLSALESSRAVTSTKGITLS